MRRICVVTGVLAAICLPASRTLATDISIPNFSFEGPAQADGGQNGFTFITGWTAFNGLAGIENPAATRFAQVNDIISDPHADGHQYAQAMLLPGQVSGWSSGILGTVQPNTTYTLTVALGHGLDVPTTDFRFFLLGSGNGLAVQDFSGSSIAAGTFQDAVMTYNSPASGSAIGSNLTVTIRLTNDNTVFSEGIFDNVRLDASPTVAPEPTGALMLGCAALIFLMRRRSVN